MRPKIFVGAVLLILLGSGASFMLLRPQRSAPSAWANALGSVAASVNAHSGALSNVPLPVSPDTSDTAILHDLQRVDAELRMAQGDGALVDAHATSSPDERAAVVADIRTTGTLLEGVLGKVSARLAAEESAGNDVAALLSSLDTVDGLVADALTQDAGSGTTSGHPAAATSSRSLDAGIADLAEARADTQRVLDTLRDIAEPVDGSGPGG